MKVKQLYRFLNRLVTQHFESCWKVLRNEGKLASWDTRFLVRQLLCSSVQQHLAVRGDSSIAVHLKGSHRCFFSFLFLWLMNIWSQRAQQCSQQLVHEFLTSPPFNGVNFFFCSPATSLCAVSKSNGVSRNCGNKTKYLVTHRKIDPSRERAPHQVVAPMICAD